MRYLLVTTLLIGLGTGLFLGFIFGAYAEARSHTKYVKVDGSWK